MKLYCTECNTELEIAKIEGMPLPQMVCTNCFRMERGYEKHEKELVADLQDYLKDELWKVSHVLSIFRKHLKRKK